MNFVCETIYNDSSSFLSFCFHHRFGLLFLVVSVSVSVVWISFLSFTSMVLFPLVCFDVRASFCCSETSIFQEIVKMIQVLFLFPCCKKKRRTRRTREKEKEWNLQKHIIHFYMSIYITLIHVHICIQVDKNQSKNDHWPFKSF